MISTRTALVLAAHGSRTEPASNALVRGHARRIERMNFFDEVAVAFHQGSPAFSEVLDQLTAKQITVVPMMTSKGYYAEQVLPSELAKNRRFTEVEVRQTAPIGTHPFLATLVMDRVADLKRQYGLDLGQSELLIVGHGTPRHPQSRVATEKLAENLRAMNTFAGVIESFLDESPTIEEAYARLTCPNVVVIPFLVGFGMHVNSDIPMQLGMNLPHMVKLPLRQWIKGRQVICDAAVGSNPSITNIILDLTCMSGHAKEGFRVQPAHPEP